MNAKATAKWQSAGCGRIRFCTITANGKSVSLRRKNNTHNTWEVWNNADRRIRPSLRTPIAVIADYDAAYAAAVAFVEND